MVEKIKADVFRLLLVSNFEKKMLCLLYIIYIIFFNELYVILKVYFSILLSNFFKSVNWILIFTQVVVRGLLKNSCGKISWQSIVWSGPGLTMSRPASLEVMVWLRSGAGQHSMTKKFVCGERNFFLQASKNA